MAKKAFIVGINAYDPPNALPSCVTDAETFGGFLQGQFGFELAGKLLDRDASKANIIDGLRRLTADAGDDDELVFYYSGHGYRQQIGDGYVESIVPQDADFLTSLDLSAVTVGLRPAALTIIFDSCHSGGMQKAFTLTAGVRPALVKFFQVPDDERKKDFYRDVPATTYTAFGSDTRPIESTPLVGPPTSTTKDFSTVEPQHAGITRNFIMFSACQADETAAASTERTEGKSAFTYALLSQMNGAEANVEDLMRNTGKALRALGLRQTPMLKVPNLPPQLSRCAFLSWDRPLPASPSKGFGALSVAELWPASAAASSSVFNSVVKKGLSMSAMSTAQLGDDSIQLEKGWLSDISGLVRAATPIAVAGLQAYSRSTKGYEEPPAEVDKAWFDTLTRTIATVIPAVVQGMQSMSPPSKAFETNTAPFDKSWFDSISSVAAAVIPHIVAELKTTQQPHLRELSAAAQKGWFDDVTHVVSSVLPIVIGAVHQSRAGAAQKGFQPLGVDDKSFWSTLGHVAQVAAPIALSFL